MAIRQTIWRGYDTVRKVWLDHHQMIARQIYLKPDGTWANAHGIIPMQFTGMCDQTKKAMFEGDIIEFAIPNEFGSATRQTGVLGWSDPTGGFVAFIRCEEQIRPPLLFHIVDPLIIGNTIDDQDKIPVISSEEYDKLM